MKVIFKDVVKRANSKEDRFNTEKIYYVGGEHIHSNELVINERGNIKGSTIGPMFYFGFKAGQVLFVTRNPHLRKAAMVEFDGICSEKTLVLETMNPSVLRQDYLPIIMQSDNFWHYCEEHKSGGVNYFVNWSTLANYEFDLPSIEKQKEISNKVWAAYRLKQAYKKLLAATDEMVKSQFIEMFSKYSSETPWYKLLTIINGKAYPEEYNNIGTYPICGSAGIMYYGERKLCDANTIILGRKGNINHPIYMESDYWIVDTAFCLDVNKSILHPKYFYYWCCQYDFTKLNKQGVLPSLTRKDLEKIEMSVPPMVEQKKFVSIVEQADKSKFELKQCIENIDKVIKSLING